jgi:hypothetical protein
MHKKNTKGGTIPVRDVYFRLAKHLQDLIMGYPYNEALNDLLKETYSPVEAQVAIAIPNNQGNVQPG